MNVSHEGVLRIIQLGSMYTTGLHAVLAWNNQLGFIHSGSHWKDPKILADSSL